ncbi:MAG: hypothetical protein EBY30_15850, partial [Rhodospirillales bacterium]|nr:hypothetical protein [Rhodospirillales bacterium]
MHSAPRRTCRGFRHSGHSRRCCRSCLASRLGFPARWRHLEAGKFKGGRDGAAHQGALDQGGPTVAFIGTGIDRVYPAQHHVLARSIAARKIRRLRRRPEWKFA